MKKLIVILFSGMISYAEAQELYTYTEPASNMAAKSLGIRMSNYFMKDLHSDKTNIHILPELMVGVSKKLMIHAQAFLSNRNNSFVAEGGSLYIKYRMLSVDDIHSHFRLAAYGRYSFNNSDVHQPAIDLQGHNSGFESGLIATKLIHKIAVSSSASLLHASDNIKNKFVYGDKNRTAVNYTFSAGKLMLPKEYTSYRQLNCNLMLEFLGQVNTGTGDGFLDIAPSLQFIINSRLRLDAGYRVPLHSKLHRTAPEGVLLRAEYNFFNFFK